MAQSALKFKPEPVPLLSTTEIAKRLRMNRATIVSRLEDLGYEMDPSSTAKNHLYPFDDEMEFAIKAAKDSLTGAKIHSLRIKTQLDEIKLAKERGELVQMGEAVELVQKVVYALQQEFAVRQPKRIAPALAKAKNVQAVRKTLKTDTDRIMKSLRANFPRFIGIQV